MKRIKNYLAPVYKKSAILPWRKDPKFGLKNSEGIN